MTKEQVIKIRDLYEKSGIKSYTLFLDNGRKMYSNYEQIELIWDDTNELVYCIRRNTEFGASPKDTFIMISNYDMIQYFDTYTKPETLVKVTETMLSKNIINEELKTKILETFR